MGKMKIYSLSHTDSFMEISIYFSVFQPIICYDSNRTNSDSALYILYNTTLNMEQLQPVVPLPVEFNQLPVEQEKLYGNHN